MVLEIKKQEKETTQSLIHRFTKAVKGSGILVRARKIKFKRKEKSKEMKKRAAKRKEETKKKYELLAKLGKSPK